MKNRIKTILCLTCTAVFFSSVLTGCSKNAATPTEQKAVQSSSEAATEPEKIPLTPPAETTASSEPEKQSHIAFQPKVCSKYMHEVFGDTMCEAWYHMVDAMMAGKDTFACPDQETFEWMIGQFPHRCFPVVEGLVSAPTKSEQAVTDGIAHFEYTVPLTEFQEKVSQFAETIEDILNQTIKEDYSDFEKAFALYQYFSENYTYDYELYDSMKEDIVHARETTACHVFDEKSGICCELSTAYTYLLMQVGVNATIMMGDSNSYDEGHQWSYVDLNGKNYHIDPTFALGSNSLDCFLMSDEQRYNEGGFVKDTFIITSCYAQEHKTPKYSAEDDTFSELWDKRIAEIDCKKDTLYVWYEDENARTKLTRFSYQGY